MDKAYLDLALSEMKWLLSIPSPSGFTMEISEKLVARLKEMGFEPRQSLKGAVTALLGGEGRPLVLAAHVDTLGAMVRAIKPNGRLKVAHVGGLNLNAVEGENCLVHTRGGKRYTGVFQTVHPSTHVYADARALERSEENMEVVLDEDVHTQEETRALSVCAGDFVSFDPRTVFTPSGYIKSRHLDDKAGAGILLALARMVMDGALALNRKVYILFTTYEEVGHGAASALPEDAQELISVDMGCVGEDLTGDETMACICAIMRLHAGGRSAKIIIKIPNTAHSTQLTGTLPAPSSSGCASCPCGRMPVRSGGVRSSSGSITMGSPRKTAIYRIQSLFRCDTSPA